MALPIKNFHRNGMALKMLTQRPEPSLHLGAPAFRWERRRKELEDAIGHGVQQGVAARKIGVERHGRGAEPLGDIGHAEGARAIVLEQGHGRFNDLFLREARRTAAAHPPRVALGFAHLQPFYLSCSGGAIAR